MALPGETWQRMMLFMLATLLLAALPLAVLSPIRRRQGKPVKAMWVKYGGWFLIVPVVALPMVLGRVWMQATFLLVSLCALKEFARLVGLRKHRAHLWLARACVVLAYVPVFLSRYDLFLVFPAYLVLPVFLLPILLDRFDGMIRASCLVVLGVTYCGWFLAHLAFLMNADAGRQLVLAFLVVVAINDSAAYLVGSGLGRRPLAPRLSPNKTIEGFLGAIAVTVAMTFLVRFALPGISRWQTLLLGLLLALAGTCGDLAMSLIKRDVHVKDSGHVIPGQGGLLDRLDSILFATPIFFHFMRCFCAAGGVA